MDITARDARVAPGSPLLRQLHEFGTHAGPQSAARFLPVTSSEALQPVTARHALTAGSIDYLNRLLSPPRNVQPPFLRKRTPYRPLPICQGPVNGVFLAPKLKNYVDTKGFREAMAAAGQRAVQAFTALRAQGPVTPEQVRAVYLQLGVARREAARDLQQDPQWEDFGRPVPNDYGEQDSRNFHFTYLFDEPGHRHYAYYGRAHNWGTVADHNSRWLEENGNESAAGLRPLVHLEVDGLRLRGGLCRAHIHPITGAAVISHPIDAQAHSLQRLAWALMAEVLNDRQLSQQDAMFRLGRAEYLLSQALPFVRGSPSCTETANDALMRVCHGVTLPAKSEGVEPVWEAILTPGAQIDAYARAYRQMFV